MSAKRKNLKRYKDLTDEQAEKAYNKFIVCYRESIEDYMGDFLFDKRGNAFQEEEEILK